jgi:hypothetical protein
VARDSPIRGESLARTDCRYDPAIFAAFERCRRAALATGRREPASSASDRGDGEEGASAASRHRHADGKGIGTACRAVADDSSRIASEA